MLLSIHESDVGSESKMSEDSAYTRMRYSLSKIAGPYIVLSGRMRKDKMAVFGAFVVVAIFIIAIFAPVLSPYDPFLLDLDKRLVTPERGHPFEYDLAGRDILSRVIYGGRLAMIESLLAVAIGVCIGTPLGLLSGYIGGKLDIVVMRITDALLSFPYLLLVILIVSVLGPSFQNAIIAIGVWSIPNYIRLVRATTLTIKEREFIDAARATGERLPNVISRHILPGCVSVITVQSTIYLGRAIEMAAGLSFLGLGAQPPTPEWGAMVGLGRIYLQLAPHVVLFPSIAIFIAILGFNALGDALRDALDPRLRGAF